MLFAKLYLSLALLILFPSLVQGCSSYVDSTDIQSSAIRCGTRGGLDITATLEIPAQDTFTANPEIYKCTGVQLAASADGTSALVLTAAHCIESDAAKHVLRGPAYLASGAFPNRANLPFMIKRTAVHPTVTQYRDPNLNAIPYHVADIALLEIAGANLSTTTQMTLAQTPPPLYAPLRLDGRSPHVFDFQGSYIIDDCGKDAATKQMLAATAKYADVFNLVWTVETFITNHHVHYDSQEYPFYVATGLGSAGDSGDSGGPLYSTAPNVLWGIFKDGFECAWEGPGWENLAAEDFQCQPMDLYVRLDLPEIRDWIATCVADFSNPICGAQPW